MIMKKQELLKLTACTCLTVALMAAPVFAAETDGSIPTTPLQSAQPTDSTPAVLDAAKESAALNMLTTGKVSEVTDNKEYYTIHIENDNMGMVINAKPGTFVVDQAKPTETLSVSDIKKDMTITAVIAKNAPMTMSIPPMTSGVVGFVINSDPGFTDLSVYNDELTNETNTLKLNVDDTTPIINANGAKMKYSADDLKGSECLVLYTVSTRSIPAQTAPQLVVIMNTAQDLEDAAKAKADAMEEAKKADQEAQSYLALRENVEKKGYTVNWTGNDKPITLTKGDITITITIGSTEYTSNAVADSDAAAKLTMEKAPKLENGKTYTTKAFLDSLN